jgi:uncharacterized phage protein (TIGR02220 family)
VDPETGALYSRRLVRDEELRQLKKECGSLGGNPVLLKPVVNQNPTTEVNQSPTMQVKQNQTPSFSVSTSSSPSVSSSISENKKDLKALACEHDFEAPIRYLNEKTKTFLDPKNKEAQRLVRERYQSGRTFEDFKRVIDKKVEEWGHDTKMRIYLRAETLFDGKHFDRYCEELEKQAKVKAMVSRIARSKGNGNPGRRGF